MRTTRIEAFLGAVAEWARADPGVRAAILVGPQTRVDTPADEWSDVDVVLVVDDPAPLAADELGAVLLHHCDTFDAVAAGLGVAHPATAAARTRLVGLLS